MFVVNNLMRHILIFILFVANYLKTNISKRQTDALKVSLYSCCEIGFQDDKLTGLQTERENRCRRQNIYKSIFEKRLQLSI